MSLTWLIWLSLFCALWYVGAVDTKNKLKTYWLSMATVKDTKSGELENKLKTLVKTEVKAEMKSNKVKALKGEKK